MHPEPLPPTAPAAGPWPASVAVYGDGQGALLHLTEPLSFWGGYDAAQGRVVEPGHPQHGARLGGQVLLMARAKGSSSSSSVLAEAIRNGTGPAAIVMLERDLIVGLGCIVASELYGLHVPVVVVIDSVWLELVGMADSKPSELVVATREATTHCELRLHG